MFHVYIFKLNGSALPFPCQVFACGMYLVQGLASNINSYTYPSLLSPLPFISVPPPPFSLPLLSSLPPSPQPIPRSCIWSHHRHCWYSSPLEHSQPSHSCSRSGKHIPLCSLLHTTEENQYHQHVGWITGRGHPSTNGLDSLHRDAGPGGLCAGRDSLRMAVSTLQCPELETERRLLKGWLPHDVCTQPRTVQEDFIEILSLVDSHLCPGPCAGYHHVVVLGGLTASEWVAQLPRLAVLSRL